MLPSLVIFEASTLKFTPLSRISLFSSFLLFLPLFLLNLENIPPLVYPIPSVPVASYLTVSIISMSAVPIFSKRPFFTSPYISPFASIFPLSFLINVSAINVKLPSDNIFPLLFSIILPSKYVFSLPFIKPVPLFNSFPSAFT